MRRMRKDEAEVSVWFREGRRAVGRRGARRKEDTQQQGLREGADFGDHGSKE